MTNSQWPCAMCPMRETGFCGTLLTAPTSKLPLKEKPPWQEFRQFRVGDKVLDGEPSRHIYVLCHGWAFRYKRLSDGRRQIFNFLLSGDLFSPLAVIRGEMRVSVQALTEISVSAFERAEVTERLADHPLLSRKVLETCVTNAGLWERVIMVLGQGSAEERIAFLLLHLTRELSRRNIIRDHSYPFPLRLQHIADATGLTPIHVSRIIGRLRKRNIVDMSGARLTVTDPTELERIGSLN